MKRPRVTFDKLGREGLYGEWSSDGYIVIDSRLHGKKFLEICAHEIAHHYFPKASEPEVIQYSVFLTKFIWDNRERLFNNKAEYPMQDGSE